jgi:hypothetical protein
MDRSSPVADYSLPAHLTYQPAAARLSAEAEKLINRIERAVRRGTNDKVRELRVEMTEEGIVLRGRCGTYYCKQLAQSAAMAAAEQETLVNRIEVW